MWRLVFIIGLIPPGRTQDFADKADSYLQSWARDQLFRGVAGVAKDALHHLDNPILHHDVRRVPTRCPLCKTRKEASSRALSPTKWSSRTSARRYTSPRTRPEHIHHLKRGTNDLPLNSSRGSS